jgi:hypothetical protein
MKKIFSLCILTVFCFISFSFSVLQSTNAASINNISIGGSAGNESSNANRNDKLQDFNERDQFIGVTTG